MTSKIGVETAPSVLRGDQVRDVSDIVDVAVPNHGDGRQPTIQAVRDGESISEIKMRCTCGEVIRLKCEY